MNNTHTIEQLKESINLVEYAAQFVDLKKNGVNHFGCCPFHSESTPSFTINENKQFYYCFGCGASGSVVDFIMGIYSVDVSGAARQMESHLGIKQGEKLEVVRNLTAEQKKAEEFVSRCEIVSIDIENGEIPEACASLADYSIFLDSVYSLEGIAAVPIRSKKAVEDVLLINRKRGELLNNNRHDGYAVVGNYDDNSQHLYISLDYIDAVYLHKLTGGNNLIIFSPHLSESINRDFPQHEPRLILPNTPQGHKVLETYMGLYVMPEEEGYFCEKDRKQTLKGVRNAK